MIVLSALFVLFKEETSMTLVVLAAGMGSRYGGLKQLDPITEHGEFIIDFSVFDALRAGYTKVVFIIKKENYELFRSTIGRRIERVIDVAYAFQGLEVPAGTVTLPPERTKPLGTAHALLSARHEVDDKFAVINADDYYGIEAFRQAKDYLTSVGDGHFCLVGFTLKNTLTEYGTVSRGICEVNDGGYLTSIAERVKIRHSAGNGCAEYADGDEWVQLPYSSIASMNFFGFDPTIFDFTEKGLRDFLTDPATDLVKGEYFLPVVVSKMRQAGKCDLRVLHTSDRWHGITYQEDKPEVVRCLKQLALDGLYPDMLWK